MKAAELKQMSDEQLALTLKEAKEDSFKLRMKARTQKLDAPSEIKKKRRLIARVKTVQTQREMAAQGAAESGKS